MNARFTAWINNGYVKITLQPGQTLSWGKSWRHEEGWSSESETWEYADGGVYSTMFSDGVDCDGRLSREQTYFCPLSLLRDKENAEGTLMPAWERVSEGQRDYSAEAMGY